MLKKMVILAVIGFVGVTVLAGTKIGSYIRSEFQEARKRVEDNIAPEKEIARLRNEIKLLDKDILKIVELLAKERVDVQQLEAQVKELAARQEKDKALLTSRAEAIKNATEFVMFGNRKVRIDAAKAELQEGVNRYTAAQKALDAMEQTLAQRIKNRDLLEKQLETLKDQKETLKVAVDGMEAELNALKLQQMESKYQTDDTRLAKIKEDLKKLQTRVDVEREKLKLMPKVFEAPATSDISGKSVDDIIAPLNGSSKAANRPRDDD
ncbi:MAG: hypothetical protein RMJ56_02175 [Gemmataceae bacterium]|nr:hypothetical protein [Gemmata sp.]MDW8196392.1 hypothetical protein [Gemmataceae bacterium]